MASKLQIVESYDQALMRHSENERVEVIQRGLNLDRVDALLRAINIGTKLALHYPVKHLSAFCDLYAESVVHEFDEIFKQEDIKYISNSIFQGLRGD